jgi:hypothetical protein
LAKPEAKLRRDIGGVGKIVDVRRFILELGLGGDAADEKLDAAGIVGTLVPLEVTIGISPNGSAKISELVEVLFGQALPHLAVRVALIAGAGTPFELLPHRRVVPPPRPKAEAVAAGA